MTRLTGTGPNLVLTPYGNSSKFEAWRFLKEPNSQPTHYQSQAFEGVYAWQTLSKAYAENEWNATEPWNVPTSITLDPGQSVSFALRFSIATKNHEIEDVVAGVGLPVAVGIPGYVLPTDMDGRLYLKSPSAVKSVMSEPAGMLSMREISVRKPAWNGYVVNVVEGAHGRVRVSISYEDGKTQTVHYFVTDSQSNTASKLAGFLFEEQWFTDPDDPFKRAPSVISYDYHVHQQLSQDNRTWIAGLSDEGGAGSFVAAAIKTAARPVVEQVRKLEDMVNVTVWGHLQNRHGGPGVHEVKYGVKKSLFYHEPATLPDYEYNPSYNWTSWASWNKSEAYAIDRAYDYVHVSVLYWSLYRAERVSPGALALQNATWYLTQAYETVLASQGPGILYSELALMGETIWLFILQDLKSEGFNSEHAILEKAMKKRHHRWARQKSPFGSEMAWDSTGQEGVYIWSR